jgi:hypothetical protein
MRNSMSLTLMAYAASAVMLLGCPVEARADSILEANARAVEIASTAPATPIAVRTMAIVQVAVLDAVRAVRTSNGAASTADDAASLAIVDAAVAAATRTVLLALAPAKQPAIDASYQKALAALPDGPGRAEGVAAGERSARTVLERRANDGAIAPNIYRPFTTPGHYVPTTAPVLPHWGQRKPWLMSAGDQFRPAPPPRLDSDTWRRDLDEVRSLGGRNSTSRTSEQTAIARFWATTTPAVYWPIVRGVALARARGATGQAQLLAEAAMAMDDAMIAVFDAKYAYGFWRPITAIRNTSTDNRDAGWEPLVETPMHPEYPCAHCIVAAAVAVVLEGAIGDEPSPRLRSTSPTADGAERSWSSPAEFVREVSEARILAGVHYRNSTRVGQEMGRRIGELARRHDVDQKK